MVTFVTECMPVGIQRIGIRRATVITWQVPHELAVGVVRMH